MFEVRFEETSGARWRVGWWLATIGAALIVVGLGGAFVGPALANRLGPEAPIYFAIGIVAATIGVAAFLIGRNLMFRRIVTQVADPHQHEQLSTNDDDNGD